MPMRPLKTKHSYHDANIRAVEFEAADSTVFEVELCGCSDIPGATVHLSFHGVRNIEEVRSFIDALVERAEGRPRIAEIVGIVREDDRRILMDLDRGPLFISARSFMET